MGVESDFSDVDQFFQKGTWDVEKKMIDVGDESVKFAEDHGTYQDHTLNLRTSIRQYLRMMIWTAKILLLILRVKNWNHKKYMFLM